MNTLHQESARLTTAMGRKTIEHAPKNGALAFICDDVLENPHVYADEARCAPFHSVAVGAAWFHGIADAESGRDLLDWLVAKFPHARPTLSFFRESPEGQVEPNFIHTDRDMGDWTAILYLNETPAAGDGTIFWQDTKTGEMVSRETDVHAEGERWNDRARWSEQVRVGAKFNRCVVFSSALFHSRALFENYGTAGQDARLIQIVFGAGSLEQP